MAQAAPSRASHAVGPPPTYRDTRPAWPLGLVRPDQVPAAVWARHARWLVHRSYGRDYRLKPGLGLLRAPGWTSEEEEQLRRVRGLSAPRPSPSAVQVNVEVGVLPQDIADVEGAIAKASPLGAARRPCRGPGPSWVQVPSGRQQRRNDLEADRTAFLARLEVTAGHLDDVPFRAALVHRGLGRAPGS